MNEAFLARKNLDECAELFRANDPALISRTAFDFLRHAADNFLLSRHRFAAGRVNVNRAVVLDVNFSTGLGHDTLDRLAARTDERANLLGIDFDRLNPWRDRKSVV